MTHMKTNLSQEARAYPTSVVVKRAINTCTKAGLTIGAVEILQDGTVRIVSVQGAQSLRPDNDFDRLDATGALG